MILHQLSRWAGFVLKNTGIVKLLFPEKEVTREPKPPGAQLPYESDPFEPGNLVLRPVP